MGRRKGPEKTTICPTYRLKSLLQLGNNSTLFRNFRQQLYCVAEKHLDINKTPRLQVDAWIAIEAELLSTFPDIFECEGPKPRLDLAMQLIAAYHRRRRFAYKQERNQATERLSEKRKLVVSVSVLTRAAMKKKREKAKKREEEDFIDLTSDDDDEYYENQKVELVEPKLPQMMDISNSQPGPTIIKVATRSASPLGPISSPFAGPSTLLSPASPVKLQSTPRHAKGSSQAQSSNANSNQRNPDHLTGVTRVAGFLNACFPSMTHFLKHFVDFGCTSEEYLRAVSTWPTDKISYFLGQVSGHGGDGRKLSEMDILVLQNHFISYFNKAQA